jgi:hypothetical protein
MIFCLWTDFKEKNANSQTMQYDENIRVPFSPIKISKISEIYQMHINSPPQPNMAKNSRLVLSTIHWSNIQSNLY